MLEKDGVSILQLRIRQRESWSQWLMKKTLAIILKEKMKEKCLKRAFSEEVKTGFLSKECTVNLDKTTVNHMRMVSKPVVVQTSLRSNKITVSPNKVNVPSAGGIYILIMEELVPEPKKRKAEESDEESDFQCCFKVDKNPVKMDVEKNWDK